ncbi:MAG TPA: hypothetical protein VNT24_10410 [Propionibacteriaceae bacterium]|nr:hypothetical protein [Propionibacteriaceae bacterium]
MSMSLKSENDLSRLTKVISSGVGTVRSSLRRGVGGTGGEAVGSVLAGNRVRTAARTGSPGGTTAPHVEHTRPPWLTPSHTRQRQTLIRVDGR